MKLFMDRAFWQQSLKPEVRERWSGFWQLLNPWVGYFHWRGQSLEAARGCRGNSVIGQEGKYRSRPCSEEKLLFTLRHFRTMAQRVRELVAKATNLSLSPDGGRRKRIPLNSSHMLWWSPPESQEKNKRNLKKKKSGLWMFRENGRLETSSL